MTPIPVPDESMPDVVADARNIRDPNVAEFCVRTSAQSTSALELRCFGTS